MASITVEHWGYAPDGSVKCYKITNQGGNSVSVLSYGGIIQSVLMDGEEMVLGYDDLAGYLGENPSYGALIGRYANRIANATFTLDGREYHLAANENEHHLHGGPEGFGKKNWRVEIVGETQSSLRLSRISTDGEMGYPGRITVECTYSWSDDNELKLHYQATTGRKTVINLTNHTYFNLGRDATVLDYLLHIDADRFTPVLATGLPTGQIEEVAGGPLDFREVKAVGPDIDSDDPQIKMMGGYDHNFVINDHDGSLREIALISDPASGRKLRCFTTEPGVQLFTTNFPPGKFTGRGNTPLPTHGGICLETQHFPDSPNHENFPTTVLKPGETFDSTTVYRFE